MKRIAITIAGALALAGCGGAGGGVSSASAPSAAMYDESADASADVEAALARAQASGKRVLLAMGANWCSDSRALAGWLESPRFQALIEDKYELVFVDIGARGHGRGRNLDIAERYGLDGVTGLPNLLVLTPDGTLVNGESAKSWRNAEKRSGDAIYAELVALADKPV